MQPAARAVPGDIDTRFGDGGLARYTLLPADFHARAVLGAGGEIHLVGTSDIDPTALILGHLDADGGIPPGSAPRERMRHTLVSGQSLGNVRCAMQSDGKIVAFGRYGSFADSHPFFARIAANGELDISFGEGGVVVIPDLWGRMVQNAGVAIQADGKIVAASSGFTPDHEELSALIRLEADGRRDAGFGERRNGIALERRGNTTFYDLLLGQDSNILVCGFAVGGASVLSYTSNGMPDEGFNNDGITTIPYKPGRYADFSAITLQPDGSVVVAGDAREDEPAAFMGIMVRVDRTGQIDSAFNGGEVILPKPLAGCRDVQVLADGRIITLSMSTLGEERAGVGCWLPDGRPDFTFGNQGHVIVELPTETGSPTRASLDDLLVQTSTRLLIGCCTAAPENGIVSPILARLII